MIFSLLTTYSTLFVSPGGGVIKELFERPHYAGFWFALLVIISVVLMIVDHRSRATESFRSALSVAILPVHYIVDRPITFFEELYLSVVSHGQLEEENAALHAEQLLLKAQLQRLISLESENLHLKNLSDATDASRGEKVVAQMLAVDLGPFSAEAVLNKGSHHGVYVGQPVLDAYGILGQVIDVNPYTSRISLITDQRVAVPVESSRNGARAVAQGAGRLGAMRLQHIPDTSDIEVGDVLLSSGLGDRFPAGYPVGEVVSISPDKADYFTEIEIKPFAKLNRSRQVILIWPRFDDFDEPEEAFAAEEEHILTSGAT